MVFLNMYVSIILLEIQAVCARLEVVPSASRHLCVQNWNGRFRNGVSEVHNRCAFSISKC